MPIFTARTTVLHRAAATVVLAAAVLAQAQAQAQAQPQPAATGATTPQGEHRSDRLGHRMGHHAGHQSMGPDMAGGMLPERALDGVGATAEQKTKVRDIFKAARADLRAQHDAGATLHAQMLALLAAPNIDPAAAEALRQQQSTRHDTASKRMLQAMLDASAVLTPEQRQKLAEQAKARPARMERGQHLSGTPRG